MKVWTAAVVLGLAGCDPPPVPPVPATPVPAAAPERAGVIHRDGKPLTLIGAEVKVGDAAPAFELWDADMKPVRSTELAGKVLVLSVVPSLDTPVCERQTGRIASSQHELPPDVAFLTVSRDLPFAQRRVLEANGLATRAASDYRDGTFGRSFGVLVKESMLLARSLWVVDRAGRVVYREIVDDQKTEPAYDPMVAAVKKALEG